jgi:hypothetical protein
MGYRETLAIETLLKPMGQNAQGPENDFWALADRIAGRDVAFLGIGKLFGNSLRAGSIRGGVRGYTTPRFFPTDSQWSPLFPIGKPSAMRQHVQAHVHPQNTLLNALASLLAARIKSSGQWCPFI